MQHEDAMKKLQERLKDQKLQYEEAIALLQGKLEERERQLDDAIKRELRHEATTTQPELPDELPSQPATDSKKQQDEQELLAEFVRQVENLQEQITTNTDTHVAQLAEQVAAFQASLPSKKVVFKK